MKGSKKWLAVLVGALILLNEAIAGWGSGWNYAWGILVIILAFMPEK